MRNFNIKCEDSRQLDIDTLNLSLRRCYETGQALTAPYVAQKCPYNSSNPDKC